MKFTKILRAVSAAVLAVGLCGCSIRFGTNIAPENSYLVAKPSDSSLTEKLGVTYAEFMNDYTYYLNGMGIKDDSAESVAETCKSRRQAIIESLILEKICVLKAEEYGVSELTDEELEQAKSMADAIISERTSYYAKNLDYGTIDPSGLSDEEKQKRADEALDKALAEFDYTREDYVEKQKRYVLGFKVLEALGETLDRGEAEKQFDDNAKLAKETYESSVSDYEQSSTLSQYYIPEGSRYIKHILLGFSDDASNAILMSRRSGDDEGADKLREENAAALEEKLAEVIGKLDAGEDWDTLVNEYSADKAASAYYPDGYLLIPNGTSFVKEFQDASFTIGKIGERTTCVTDYGIHILLYSSDAAITEFDREIAVERIFSNMMQSEFTKKTAEWIKEYGFYDNMDYSVLRIDKLNDEESSK